jgi:lipoprotein-anchoring transpeptidase ErfK/SrfK
MRRISMWALMSVVLASAFSASAFAQATYGQVIYGQPAYGQATYAPYPANGAVYVTQQAAPPAYPVQQYPQQYVYGQQIAPTARQQYYVYAPQPRYAAAPQSSYVPAQQPLYAAAQQPVYPAAAPAYTGSVAPRYVAAAPPIATAPAAPAYNAPAAPVAPPVTVASSSGGGGFLEAIFGGPTIEVRRDYQPGLPQYQPAPAPQPTTPQAAYAPSGQVDMSAYPIDPKFNRQIVEYRGEHKPGTIIIDTPNKFLYLVEDGGRALRYGIGVGRPGFTWSGEKEITAMREWPDWRPPVEMLARRPDLPRYMPGGADNPLGARAMYLGSTLYRIHGSNEPWTIGTNVSSGCIRMRNEDVTDLYGRVKIGTKVVVI